MRKENIGQSRLFVILAIALVGLLILGLLGIGGVFVIRQNLQGQAALSEPTATLIVRLPNPTATSVPVKAEATNTPAPTPTNTPVVAPGEGGSEAAVGRVSDTGDGGQAAQGGLLPVPSPRAPAESGNQANLPNEVPETGLGALEAIAIALAFGAVLFIARRMRLRLS